MRTSPVGNNGFTLVELVVVIVIITVLSAAAIPQITGSTQAAQLRRQANQLLLTARYARNYAITHRCVCQLAIDRAQGRYALGRQSDPSDEAGEAAAAPGGPAKQQQLSGGVAFGRVWIGGAAGRQTDGDVITFDPAGRVDPASVELAAGRRIYTLLLIPSSGRAILVDGAVSALPDDRRDLDE